MRFLPREEKFFIDFMNQVKIISEAAEVLERGVSAGNSEMKDAAVKIRELESRGDNLVHDVVVRLHKTFITPIDPEDIHKLATELDNVIDGIEEAAHRLASHGVEPIPPPVKRMAQYIKYQVKAIERGVIALSEDKPVGEHCIEINRLENEADQLFRETMTDLYLNETNAIQLIKLKEIYDTLEWTTDSCEEVAIVLEQVTVKNG
jgi:uncharacterized protein